MLSFLQTVVLVVHMLLCYLQHFLMFRLNLFGSDDEIAASEFLVLDRNYGSEEMSQSKHCNQPFPKQLSLHFLHALCCSLPVASLFSALDWEDRSLLLITRASPTPEFFAQRDLLFLCAKLPPSRPLRNAMGWENNNS